MLTQKLHPYSSLHACRGFCTQGDRLSPIGRPVTQFLSIAVTYSLHNLAESVNFWFPGYVRFISSLSLMSPPLQKKKKVLHSTPPSIWCLLHLCFLLLQCFLSLAGGDVDVRMWLSIRQIQSELFARLFHVLWSCGWKYRFFIPLSTTLTLQPGAML